MWHSYDCMKIKLLKQFLLDIYLCIINTKEETIRKNNSTSTIFFLAEHNNIHE